MATKNPKVGFERSHRLEGAQALPKSLGHLFSWLHLLQPISLARLSRWMEVMLPSDSLWNRRRFDKIAIECGWGGTIAAPNLGDHTAFSRAAASATPRPYSGSALAQLSMCLCLTSSLASPIARAVFSYSACFWVGVIIRKRSPGC